MNYKELSNEYLKQYKFLAIYVKNLNIEFKKVQSSLNFKEKTIFKRRIYLIYTMALELKHNSKYLDKCTKREKNICQKKNLYWTNLQSL